MLHTEQVLPEFSSLVSFLCSVLSCFASGCSFFTCWFFFASVLPLAYCCVFLHLLAVEEQTAGAQALVGEAKEARQEAFRRCL